ncbi:MAG: hypothetical protein ACE5H7_17575 [Acidiferrobacterales bacterium]
MHHYEKYYTRKIGHERFGETGRRYALNKTCGSYPVRAIGNDKHPQIAWRLHPGSQVNRDLVRRSLGQALKSDLAVKGQLRAHGSELKP